MESQPIDSLKAAVRSAKKMAVHVAAWKSGVTVVRGADAELDTLEMKKVNALLREMQQALYQVVHSAGLFAQTEEHNCADSDNAFKDRIADIQVPIGYVHFRDDVLRIFANDNLLFELKQAIESMNQLGERYSGSVSNMIAIDPGGTKSPATVGGILDAMRLDLRMNARITYDKERFPKPPPRPESKE